MLHLAAGGDMFLVSKVRYLTLSYIAYPLSCLRQTAVDESDVMTVIFHSLLPVPSIPSLQRR